MQGFCLYFLQIWLGLYLKYKRQTQMNAKSSLRSYIQSSNILECPICLQDYNLTNRQPMIVCINFQTIHSICSECVTNKAFAINSTSKAYTCSICRKPIELNSIKKHQSLLQWIKLTQILQIKFQKDKQFYQQIIQNTKGEKEEQTQLIHKLKLQNQNLSKQTQLLREQIIKIIKTKEQIQTSLGKRHLQQLRQKDEIIVKLQRDLKELKEKYQKIKSSNDFVGRLNLMKKKQEKMLSEQIKNNCFAKIYQQEHNSTSLLLGRQNINDEKLLQFVALSWPKLQTLYLDGNLLTQFDQLSKIKSLKLLRLDENNLGKKSAQKLLNVKFNNLTHLLISFSNSQSNQCWQILVNDKFHSFPALKMLRICGSKYILDKVKQKIKQWSEIERNGKISIVWFQ